MPYVSPATVVTLTPISSTWGNSVKAATDWLENQPCCRVYNNANISLTDATETTVTFNAERNDPQGMHSTSSNTGRITFPADGFYVVTFHGILATGSDYNLYYAYIRLNGTTNIGGMSGSLTTASSTPNLSVTTLRKFSASDYVEVRIYQDNAANAARNLLFVGESSPEFAAGRLAAG